VHVGALPQDHTGAQKSDAGHDLCGDPRGVSFTHHGGEHHKTARAERNQGIGAQARHLLVPLPLETYGSSEQ
jgi:hypothetical protein